MRLILILSRLSLRMKRIFRQISLEENNEALAEMKKSAEEKAIEDGLLENARANAETILKGFFRRGPYGSAEV